MCIRDRVNNLILKIRQLRYDICYKLIDKFALMNVEKIILGIDPGTSVMGFGIISVEKGKMKLVAIDELVMKKAVSYTHLDVYKRQPLLVPKIFL